MHLLVMNGGLKGRRFELKEGQTLIGRADPENDSVPDIDLSEADDEAKVSRRHAIIVRSGSTLTITDAGSLNGTYLNRDEVVRQGTTSPLKPSDEILIGKIILRVEKATS